VESGLIDWSIVPTASIQRIEAFRGPGASMYGDAAIGGVIQIFTAREQPGGQLTLGGGSFRTFTGDGAYGGRTQGVGYTVSGAVRTTDGGVEHSGGHQVVGGARLDGRAGAWLWHWSGSGDRRERDDPGAPSRESYDAQPGALQPLHAGDGVERRSLSTALTLRHDTLAWHPQVRIYASQRDEDLIRTILLAPDLGDRRARRLDSTTVGGSVDGERLFAPARPVTVRFGTDLATEQLDTAYHGVTETGGIAPLETEASGRRIRTGAFVSAAWDLTPRVRASSAVRWDGVDDGDFGAEAESHRAWSPRAGLVVTLRERDALSVYLQASRAFKAPTLDQRFDPRPFPDFQGGSFTISNPALAPQRATSIEAGVSAGGRVRWSALAYRMAVEDEIDFDVRTFSYQNLGDSVHAGVEAEIEARWPLVRPSLSYAYSRVTEQGADDGRQLKNVPRHAVAVAATADLPLGIGAYLRYQHRGGAYLDDENRFAVRGPSTLDARIRRSIGRHVVFLDVLNATNDRYEEYGFTLADFAGGTAPYVYPGAPRAVRAGMTLGF